MGKKTNNVFCNGDKSYKEVIEYMKNYREENKITQTRLAELSSIKQPMIARIESGSTDPQLSTFLTLLNGLGLEMRITPIKHHEEQITTIDFVKSINVLDGYEIDDVTKALLLLLDKGYITDDLAEEILDRKYSDA